MDEIAQSKWEKSFYAHTHTALKAENGKKGISM